MRGAIATCFDGREREREREKASGGNDDQEASGVGSVRRLSVLLELGKGEKTRPNTQPRE